MKLTRRLSGASIRCKSASSAFRMSMSDMMVTLLTQDNADHLIGSDSVAG